MIANLKKNTTSRNKYVGKVKVKLYLRLVKHHAVKAYGEWRYNSTYS